MSIEYLNAGIGAGHVWMCSLSSWDDVMHS